MAEVVHVFEQPIVVNGTPYSARVATRPDGHVWEAWIEFVALDESDIRRTPRETTQPDRDAVVYWATGLSGTYLEGAMRRALEPPVRAGVEPLPAARFESPTPSPVADMGADDRAVLDPFSVGAKGEGLLRNQLGALAGWHLCNIVRAYHLADESLDLEALTEPELIELIVTAVQPA